VKRAYIELHIAVLLYGLTAVLGEMLSLSALPLVWWRVGLASLCFIPLVWIARRKRFSPPRSTYIALVGIGCIIALHWITFYGAIKLSNASVALICFASTSLLTSLLEPILLKKRFDWLDVGLGALIIPGMLLIIGVVDTKYYLGIAVGLLSALLAAIFSTLNKRYVAQVQPIDMSAIQIASAFVFLSIGYPLLKQVDMGSSSFWPTASDWPILAVLVLGCTVLAYVLNTRSLRHLSAFSANLAISLEPVYGIILAAILLKQHEVLRPEFYLGSVLLFSAVMAHPIISRRRKRKLAIQQSEA
jgi:drug/metabolite transporter (DMT)-like permease